MKVKIFDKAGKASGELELPKVFATQLRPDLIRKAVKVARANRRQRYGTSPVAGERHSTESIGKGRGMSRVPRLKQGRDAALAPNVVGGRRAHPPEARTDYSLRINRKERRLAIASAIAATAHDETVKARGHRFDAKLPLIVTDDAAALAKTAELQALFAGIGVASDLERSREGTHIRAGMGKLRGRARRVPRSILVVTGEGDAPAARNLPGVDVVSADRLSAEHLAPGGDAGRLVVYTKSAIAHLKEAYE